MKVPEREPCPFRRGRARAWYRSLAVATLTIMCAALIACDAPSSVSVVNDTKARITADINDGDRTLDIEAGNESFIVLPVNYRIRITRLKSEDPAAAATTIEFRQPIPARLIIHFDGTSSGPTR